MKVEHWCNQIKVGHLPAREAWQCVSSTILKILQYPLPELTLSRQECRQLLQPIRGVDLPISKICRKFPHDLLYGSKSTLGLGWDDLYVDQGTSKIEILLEHLYTDSTTGSLLRLALEWSSIHVGIGRNLFSLDFKLFGHLLPQSWIKSLWQFASEYNIHIPAQEEHLELRREGDSLLTEMFAHSDTGTPALR